MNFCLFVFFFISREPEQSNGPSQPRRHRRDIKEPQVEPPHICIEKLDGDNYHIEKCLVYTKEMKTLPIAATLHSAINQENETNAAEWCRYPIGKFSVIEVSMLEVKYHEIKNFPI